MTVGARDLDHLLAAALSACRRAGAIERERFRAPDLVIEHKADDSPVTAADRGAEEAIREELRRAAPELGIVGEELAAEGDRRDRWIVDPLDGTRNFVSGIPFFAVLIGLELDGELVLGVVHAPALGPGSGVGLAPPTGDGTFLGETWWAIRGQGAWGGPGTALPRCRERRLRVSPEADLAHAQVVHGGLAHFRRRGLWDGFTALVDAAGRTRGFGDWWGHVLVAEGRCEAMVEARVALHDVAAIKPLIEEAGGVFRARNGAPLDAAFDEAVLTTNAALAGEIRGVLEF